jgi:ribonuclease P protein component
MKVADRFRAVRRADRIFSEQPPSALPALSSRGSVLDVRLISKAFAEMPCLLVSTPKKSGTAVTRNKFRRRVRMAFLEILKKMPKAYISGYAVWVRPSKSSPSGCLVKYGEIENLLEQSLKRLRKP